MDPVDSVLAHYGKKGMHWGIRKSISGPTAVSVKTVPGKRILSKGGEKQPASEDAIKAVAAKQKAKASTTDSLSNHELQTVVSRMNLEQQYTKLTTEAPTKTTGRMFVKSLLTNTAKSEVTQLSKGKQGPIMKFLDQSMATGGKHKK